MHEKGTCQLDATQNRRRVNNFLLALHCFIEPEVDDHHLNGYREETLDHELSVQEWVVIDYKLEESVTVDICLQSQSDIFLLLLFFTLLCYF